MRALKRLTWIALALTVSGALAASGFKSGQRPEDVRVMIERVDQDGRLDLEDLSYAEAARRYPEAFVVARIPRRPAPAPNVRMIDLEDLLFGDDLAPPSCSALQVCGSTQPVTLTIVERAFYEGRCYTRTTTFVLLTDHETWHHSDSVSSASGACPT